MIQPSAFARRDSPRPMGAEGPRTFSITKAAAARRPNQANSATATITKPIKTNTATIPPGVLRPVRMGVAGVRLGSVVPPSCRSASAVLNARQTERDICAPPERDSRPATTAAPLFTVCAAIARKDRCAGSPPDLARAGDAASRVSVRATPARR